MKTLLVVLLALLVLPTPTRAEPRLALPSAHARKLADAASWGTVLAVTALDARASWQCADRARCFEKQAIRTGVVYGAVFAAKLLVHRARPCAPACGLDNPRFSFFSGHTALAFASIGGPRLEVAVPLAIGTGGLRVAAGKHWATDTMVGAGVGWLASRIRP